LKGAVPGVDRGSQRPWRRTRQGSASPWSSNGRNKVVVSGLWTEVGIGVDHAYTMVDRAPQRTAPPHTALARVKA
jgi:hypothetical protein